MTPPTTAPGNGGREGAFTRREVIGNAVLYRGDSRAILADLADCSVDCCVTSPPYWGAQRDYGCESQLGHERSPVDFVAALVEIFRSVRRVLRDDGSMWLNMGDSYAASGKGGGGRLMDARGGKWDHRRHLTGWRSPPEGFKEKDLVGVPWMLAAALRDDGWYLRRDVVWSKGAATEPTRVDRPAGSHEMLFLLSKAKSYYFDGASLPHGTVWTVRPEGYEGHSAAFPPKLVAPCIVASCRPRGVVIDPFAGSGTTAAVAVAMHRAAIAIELNDAFADIACRRIEDAQRQGSLFGAAA